MDNHTPGPWHHKGLIGTVERGWAIFSTHAHGTQRVDRFNGVANGEFTEANAARIVACVNACEGIADPAEAIRKAREALREIRETIKNLADDEDPSDVRALVKVDAALAALGKPED